MSYSRYTDSVWYTYAHVDGGFVVEGEGHWTNAQLIRNWPLIRAQLQGRTYTEDELDELKGYVDQYLAEEAEIAAERREVSG